MKGALAWIQGQREEWQHVYEEMIRVTDEVLEAHHRWMTEERYCVSCNEYHAGNSPGR